MPPSPLTFIAHNISRSAIQRNALNVIVRSNPNKSSTITLPVERHFSSLLQQNSTNDNNKTTGAISRIRHQAFLRHRMMSSDETSTSSQKATDEKEPPKSSDSVEDDSTGEEETTETLEQKLQNEISTLKDQLLRALAEQENIRRIARRDVDNSKSYAVTSFAKSLLDTSDNLSRALEAVPPENRHGGSGGGNDVLANLYQGIEMTDQGLTKAFEKNGLVKFGEVGDVFDPNRHEALFEYAEEGKDAGTVGQVMKVGFELNSRVIRPAEVGVIKKA